MFTSTLQPGRARSGGSGHFTQTWSTGYGQWTDAQVAMFCVLRWKQVKRDGYKKLFLEAAERYMTSDPDASKVVWPGAVGDAIMLLLEVHRITGDQRYLARADSLGRIAVELFFPGDSPLPKASSRHDHYEVITRADTRGMALLNLGAAKQQPPIELDMIWPERQPPGRQALRQDHLLKPILTTAHSSPTTSHCPLPAVHYPLSTDH